MSQNCKFTAVPKVQVQAFERPQNWMFSVNQMTSKSILLPEVFECGQNCETSNVGDQVVLLSNYLASEPPPLVSVGTQRGESCWYGSRSRLHLTRNDHSPTTNVWHLSLFEPETDISPNSRIVSSSICTYLVQIKRSKVFKSSNNGVKFIHCILFPAFSFKRNTPV